MAASRAPRLRLGLGRLSYRLLGALLRRALLVSSGLACAAAVVFYAAALASDALEGYSVERAFLVTSLAEVPAYLFGARAAACGLGRCRRVGHGA